MSTGAAGMLWESVVKNPLEHMRTTTRLCTQHDAHIGRCSVMKIFIYSTFPLPWTEKYSALVDVLSLAFLFTAHAILKSPAMEQSYTLDIKVHHRPLLPTSLQLARGRASHILTLVIPLHPLAKLLAPKYWIKLLTFMYTLEFSKSFTLDALSGSSVKQTEMDIIYWILKMRGVKYRGKIQVS